MKIQTRLSLISSGLWGVVFLIVALLIFGLYKQNIESSIYKNLEKTSYIIGYYFFEEDEISENEFLKIKTQYDSISKPYYQIYDENNHLRYGDKNSNVPVKTIEEIRNKKTLAFTTDEFLCFGVYYKDNQGNFVIITKDKKEDLHTYINPLIWILISAFLIGMLATVFLNKIIANIAYRPIRETIKQVNAMSPGSLEQLKLPGTKDDELYDLTQTFNELLSRISDAFKIQQNFVSYVSHEFKTPLASIQGNLEVFSLRDRSPEEYRRLTENLIEEITQLEEILDTLLIISDLRKNTDIPESIRIDELILEIVKKVSEKHKGAEQIIYFNLDISPEASSLLQVNIDRTQLFMALFNLIENAVKFSRGKKVEIHLFSQNGLHLSITDQGIGIPKEQLKDISKPFYRADNTRKISGKGIGLSIALRILEKNSIQYSIKSEEGLGTMLTLTFP